MRHDEAKKTADEALAAWNEHVRGCLVCSNAGTGPVQDRADFVITPTVLLVDNNHALLDQLVRMLQPNCKIAATLSCGAMVVDRAAALQPDLIILDISLGDVNGFEVAKRLKSAGCSAKIIFLTLHEDMEFADAAFGLGAWGFIFKSRLTVDLEIAISAVLSGWHFSSIR
jgi:DNA-binding NarL/FixJ family response regulator